MGDRHEKFEKMILEEEVAALGKHGMDSNDLGHVSR
jgi:hypothetical protein